MKATFETFVTYSYYGYNISIFFINLNFRDVLFQNSSWIWDYLPKWFCGHSWLNVLVDSKIRAKAFSNWCNYFSSVEIFVLLKWYLRIICSDSRSRFKTLLQTLEIRYLWHILEILQLIKKRRLRIHTGKLFSFYIGSHPTLYQTSIHYSGLPYIRDLL